MRVGFDLDGILYDWAGSMRAAAHQLLGIDPYTLENPKTWEFWGQWGLTRDQFLTLFTDGIKAGIVFGHEGPRPGAREAVEQVRADGHTAHVITDRLIEGIEDLCIEATHGWFAQHQVEVDELVLSGDKTVVPTDVFIDDRAENYLALQRTDTLPVLLTYPHNSHVDATHRLDRVEQYPDWVRAHAA